MDLVALEQLYEAGGVIEKEIPEEKSEEPENMTETESENET